jgi:translation initiation factor IF-2
MMQTIGQPRGELSKYAPKLISIEIDPELIGKVIGPGGKTIKGIQEHNENIGSATVGMEVAVAIDGPTVGRQIHEGDMLYVNIPEKHARIIHI